MCLVQPPLTICSNDVTELQESSGCGEGFGTDERRGAGVPQDPLRLGSA